MQLGELEALVVPDIQDNLASFADFVDRGSTIILWCHNNFFNDTQIVLYKDFGTWRYFS